jgi:outer membrane immunogenic protein
MKNVLLSSVAFLGLTVGAMAADLPSRVAPVPVASVPVFTWTGFYVGVQAGYGWSSISTAFTGLGGVTAGELEDEGFVGGAHVGYNYQIGSFVVGLEADLEAAGFGDDTVGVRFSDGTILRAESDVSFQGSLRARLGVAFDRALIYATGGFAFANFETDYVLTEPALVTRRSFENSEWGWTLGAGVEYAFTNNLTARAEYRYTRFEGYRNDSGDDAGFFDGSSYDFDPDFHTVRVGLSYKFGSY